jgi:hypothetical protein
MTSLPVRGLQCWPEQAFAAYLRYRSVPSASPGSLIEFTECPT